MLADSKAAPMVASMVASWAVEWVAGWAVQWAVLLVGVSVVSLVDLWAASSAVSTAGPKVLQRVAHSDDLSAEPMVHLKDHK